MDQQSHGGPRDSFFSGSRVAFFGGSFDPPHLGHLGVARAARAALGLDSVLFAPVGTQPLKPQGTVAGFEDRLAMTRLAIAAEPGFALSLADAPKPSSAPNYTLETLTALRAQLPPESALFCLMGADSFAAFRRWHRAAEIPFVASLIVASRPGESLDNLDSALPNGLTIDDPDGGRSTEGGGGFNPRITLTESTRALAPEGAVLKGTGFCPYVNPATSARALSLEGRVSEHFPEIPAFSDATIELRRYILLNPAGDSAPFYLLPGLHIEISASDIRDQIRRQSPPAAAAQNPRPVLLPAPVLDYIRAHRLYC
jgi:nicotinate (nicotinamide) nucleotide adenylyltransferase